MGKHPDMGKSPEGTASEKYHYDANVSSTPVEDGRGGVIQDAVFGEITEGGPNFRSVSVRLAASSVHDAVEAFIRRVTRPHPAVISAVERDHAGGRGKM